MKSCIKGSVEKIDSCINVTVSLVCTTSAGDIGETMLWCPCYRVLWGDGTAVLWKK